MVLILVLFISLVIAFAVPERAETTRQDCIAWDAMLRDTEHLSDPRAFGRPLIDRLNPDKPYGQLLHDFEVDGCMRLNFIQVLGTHNSYHVEPRAPLFDFIHNIDPDFALGSQNSKPNLETQLGAFGVRQVELDVFADPNGGMYAMPLGALAFPNPPPGPDPINPELLQPGLKVLHSQDVDFETTCLTFKDCLNQVKSWSDANPSHLPILILVEAKDTPLTVPPGTVPPGLPPPVVPVPFTAELLSQIDAEVRSVFPPSKLITPDDVRGKRDTLEEAVLKDGWPTLNESRGRVMFALDNPDAKRELYKSGHSSLRGRVMFTNSPPGSPESAFLDVNNPLGNEQYIRKLVSRGYLVRTRPDENTVEARLGSTVRRDAALASGAQFISTDYIEPDVRFGSGYAVRIPGGGEFRCNPVLSPPTCSD